MILQWSTRSLPERISLTLAALLVLPLALLPILAADLTRSVHEMGGPAPSVLVRLALSQWFGPLAGALGTTAIYRAVRANSRSMRLFWTVGAVVVVVSAAAIVASGLLSPLAYLRTMTGPLQ